MKYLLIALLFSGCAQSGIRKTDNQEDCIKEVKKAINFNDVAKTASLPDRALAEIGVAVMCEDYNNDAQLVVAHLSK